MTKVNKHGTKPIDGLTSQSSVKMGYAEEEKHEIVILYYENDAKI